MNTLLTIKSATKTYGVQTEDTLNFISKYAAAETSFFVIDQTVYDLYTSAFSEIPPARLFLLEAKEENKTIETVSVFPISRKIKAKNIGNAHSVIMANRVSKTIVYVLSFQKSFSPI